MNFSRTTAPLKARVLFKTGIILLCATAVLFAGESDPLKRLLEGNKRFAEGVPERKNADAPRRLSLLKGQHPFATVLCCSDSRVPPEIIFDQGMGDIFIVRLAGNVTDQAAIASIEYGVEHLRTPLLVILGHQSCGAVKAALHAKEPPEGNIGALVAKIKPAVEKARASGKTDEEVLVELAVRENMKNVKAGILEASPVVKELAHAGKLKIVSMEYYFSSGLVDVIRDGKAEEHIGH